MTSRVRRGALALGILGFPLVSARAGITVIDRPAAANSTNHHYPANRRPLLPSPLVKLPVARSAPGDGSASSSSSRPPASMAISASSASS